MDFDKKTIFAFVLIGLILIIASSGFYQKLVDPKGYELKQKKRQELLLQQQEKEQNDAQEILDKIAEQKADTLGIKIKKDTEKKDNLASLIIEKSDEKIITIENNLYKADISSKGGTILQWSLKNYPGPDDMPVKLFPAQIYGTLGISFKTRDGDSLDTSELIFDVESENYVSLQNKESHDVEFVLSLGQKRMIKKKFTFYKKSYDINLQITLEDMDEIIADKKYYLTAPNGLASVEKRLKEDMQYAKAGTSSAGKVEKGYKTNGKNGPETGIFDWIGIRTKYFAFFIMPKIESSLTAEISGEQILVDAAKKEKWKKYSVSLEIPYLGEKISKDNFGLYLGPLEYDILKSYNKNLQGFMDFGMAIIKPFSLLILTGFKWMHNFIPNYGIVLLIFSIVIKIVVYPLTHKSYESMQKMQTVQPKLKELQEKYKDDPQKLNQATMRMYKEEGVNPMGGCLPMLIQMPLLFGLFIVFRTTIELRGAGFFLWINDLSAPDTIYNLPFTIPIYGSSVNILPLFMGVTMFVQQKMSVTDPKQKMMIYFMPIFFTLLFNSFPSGLNLYYAVFNLLTIIQQKYLTPKKIQNLVTETSLKRKKR